MLARMAIKRLRKQRGLSQRALAARAGISRVYLARLESGERRNPGVVTVQALAAALGVELKELLR